MTTLVARPPLQILSMSAMQAGARRLSARLQEKDDVHPKHSSTLLGGVASKQATNGEPASVSSSKKRKNDYDEDDDGFTFTRVNKNKKPRQTKQDTTSQRAAVRTTTAGAPANGKAVLHKVVRSPKPSHQDDPKMDELPQKRRKKMSFSTPKTKEPHPVRRSKRLSNDITQRGGSPAPIPAPTVATSKKKLTPEAVDEKIEIAVEKTPSNGTESMDLRAREAENPCDPRHSATKIALPFADTPVIRRNKAMREGKSMKGDRRSSLGLRGRRASSLIETGNSNALPHQEVEAPDFYKHIESDLIEPRRMRQLLTWCATRAMHAKPKGTGFEDASAKSAARIIEEELLKELSSKSELSDWFNREDMPESSKPLPERPNPKNVQNLQKMMELEEQINRLKVEKEALQTLLQPPEISETGNLGSQTSKNMHIDRTLLSEDDLALLETLNSPPQLSRDISRRINNISTNIGPSVDRFADGIHKIAQYRIATDNMAGKVLSICAEKLASREKAGRRKALQTEEDRSPGRDLSNVLRGLSKADR